jgi:hypothetical protein
MSGRSRWGSRGGVLPALALASVASLSSVPARAQDPDKKPGAETEIGAVDKPAARPVVDQGPEEVRSPPFSTRFMVLTAGLLVGGSAWAFSYAASRGWPENVCHITVAGAFNYAGQPCVSGPPGSSQLGIPVAGPWIALGKSGCASDEPNCGSAKIGLRAFAFTVDGIVQAAGVALIIQGLVMKTEPPGTAKKPSPLAIHYRGVEAQPSPVLSRGMQGLGVSGTF